MQDQRAAKQSERVLHAVRPVIGYLVHAHKLHLVEHHWVQAGLRREVRVENIHLRDTTQLRRLEAVLGALAGLKVGELAQALVQEP